MGPKSAFRVSYSNPKTKPLLISLGAILKKTFLLKKPIYWQIEFGDGRRNRRKNYGWSR